MKLYRESTVLAIPYLQTHPELAYALVFLFACLVGSFLNVVISRLPRIIEYSWYEGCKDLGCDCPEQGKKPSLLFPRSHCPRCKNPISVLSNIPVISWIIQKGKCKSCDGRISVQYPLVELTTGVFGLLSAITFGFTYEGLVAFTFSSILISIAVIDFKEYIVPDQLSITLLWIGLISSVFLPWNEPTTAIINASLVFVFFKFFVDFYELIRDKVILGGGDIKLFTALATFFCFEDFAHLLLISGLAGAIIMTFKNKLINGEKAAPFAPAIVVGGLVLLFAK